MQSAFDVKPVVSIKLCGVPKRVGDRKASKLKLWLRILFGLFYRSLNRKYWGEMSAYHGEKTARRVFFGSDFKIQSYVLYELFYNP